MAERMIKRNKLCFDSRLVNVYIGYLTVLCLTHLRGINATHIYRKYIKLYKNMPKYTILLGMYIAFK